MQVGNESNHTIDGLTVLGGLALKNPANGNVVYIGADGAGFVALGGSSLPGVMSPSGSMPANLNTTNVTASANGIRGVRVTAPRSGWLRDLSAYCVTNVAGNYALAVYDCGDALSTTYTRLYASSATTIPATGSWATPDSTTPLLFVNQGQQYIFAVAQDAAAVWAKFASPSTANANSWPTSRYNPSSQPLRDKMNFSISSASYPPAAAILDSAVTASTHVPVIIGVVTDS